MEGQKPAHPSGFSLIELIVVVAVVGIVASISIAFVGDIHRNTEEEKLSSDTGTLNRAVAAYLASGGSLTDAKTPADVLARLKTAATAELRDRMPGFTSTMVDPRTSIVMQDASEAASDDPRVHWDPVAQRFVVASSDAAGVKEFILDDSLAEVDGGTETRDATMLYAKDSTWVWDYQDRATDPYLGPSVISVVSDPATPPTPPGPGPGPPPKTLSPPDFSPPGGAYPLTDYPLTLTLTDPNPPGASKIIYAIDFGNWQDYGGTLSVSPDSTISAQAVARSSAWSDSGKVDQNYTTSPGALLPPVINLSDSKFTDSVQTITVTLTNPNPAGTSSLEYAIIDPTGTFPALASYQSYTTPISVSAGSYPDGFRISSYAKSLDTAAYLDSPTVEDQTASDFFGVDLGSRVLLVLDASGSMNSRWSNSTRFDSVVQEAIGAIQVLGPTTNFGVMTFNTGIHWSDGSNELKEATPDNKQAAISALNSLTAGGGTNYEVGLNYAAAMSEPPTQVIFLSDGLPNQANYFDEITTLVSMGIQIDTIGIGNNNSQEPLEEMATLAAGSYRFVGEPGSGGTLQAPEFSEDGNSFDYDKFPLSLTLTDRNSSNPFSQIRYSLNGGPFQLYTGPISVGYDTTVDAFAGSSDPVWAPSPVISESYLVREYGADKPEISLSNDKFTDDNLTITVTLNDRNEAGLTNLVWWFETQPESSATAYNGPFTLSAADWNTFAGELVKDVKLLARAVPAQSFVTASATGDKTLRNETTAFLLNLDKDPLERPVFSVKGDTFDYDEFPISLTLENPNSGVGNVWMSINGGVFAKYSGAISCGYNTEVRAYVKAEGPAANGFKSSETTTQSYQVGSVSLATPQISLSDDKFEGRDDTITVVITHSNPAALSSVIYWFDGQDEETQAIPYTGPITLNARDWEDYVKAGKGTAKILTRAVGTESFVKDSGTNDAKFENDN